MYENWEASLEVNGQVVKLCTWDTDGREDYDRLRPLSYPQTNIFIICFSTISSDSLANVPVKWIPELRLHSEVPFLLCGTKIDMREDPMTIELLKSKGMALISYEEGVKVANEVGAAGYVECSSITQTGLLDVFNEAARIGLNLPPGSPGSRKSIGRCNLL